MKNQWVRNSKCLDIHFLWVGTADHFGEYKWRQSTKGFSTQTFQILKSTGRYFVLTKPIQGLYFVGLNLCHLFGVSSYFIFPHSLFLSPQRTVNCLMYRVALLSSSVCCGFNLMNFFPLCQQRLQCIRGRNRCFV